MKAAAMNRSLKKAPVMLLLALAVFGAGCSQDATAKVRLSDPPAPPGDRGAASAVAAATHEHAASPAKGARVRTLRLTGRTVAARESQVTFRAQGTLAKLHVKAGDTVAADAPLAEVDDTVARLQVRLAKATVSAAEVQVRGVQREADRLRKLRARDAVPQAQLDQVDSQLEGAKAQVEQAKAQLALARQGQADMVLKAPYAGRVIARLKAEGEWVANMPPSPVVLLAQLDPLELHLEAPEQSYGQIQAGTKIQVRLPAVDRTATVTVKRVIPSVGRNRAFTVIAELPNPGGALPAGLFAEAEYTP